MPPPSRVPRHATTSTTDPKTFATSQRRASSKLAKISPERPESRAATSSSSTFSKQRRCSNRELRFTRSRFYSEVAHPLGKDNSQAVMTRKSFCFVFGFHLLSCGGIRRTTSETKRPEQFKSYI